MFRARNSRQSSHRGGSNPRSQSSRRSRNDPAVSSNNTKSQLAKLDEEYKPPFALEAKFTADTFYKLKIPHPHFPNEKETVSFPVLIKSSASFSDRALHYKQVLDIQEQTAAFAGADANNLYYTFTRCLQDEPLAEWQEILDDRPLADRANADNFATDIDTFLRQHETRDNDELLQDQLNYLGHLTKPRKMKPSKFKDELVKCNRRISLIPGADDNSRLPEMRLRSIFHAAMPPNWRKEFKKIGKSIRDENLDDLATYFDLYFEEVPSNSSNQQSSNQSDSKPHANNNRPSNSKNNNKNNNGNNRSNGGTRGRPDPEQECPIHGGHKWKDCFDNKYGPKFKPPNPNAGVRGNGSRSENHMNESKSSGSDLSSPQRDSKRTDENDETSTTEPNPYGDDFKDNGPTNPNEPVPQAIVEARQGEISYTGKALLDTGGSKSLIAKSRIPNNIKITKLDQEYQAVSAGGPVSHEEYVTFDKVCFPQFDVDVWRSNVEFIVFEDNGHSSYDLIIGRDVLQPLGFEFSFSKQTVTWMNATIPFGSRDKKPNIPEGELTAEAIENFLAESDYDTKTSGHEVAQMQKHLTKEQRDLLSMTLAEFDPMFNQVLGVYEDAKCELKLKKGAQPVFCKAFPIPEKQRSIFKAELDKLVTLKVLYPVLTSAWAFPTFLISKKDGTARFVSDFRKLNELLVDENHPLPMIKDVLYRRKGFDWVTCLDCTSQFYHFVLTLLSQEYATITTPFGLYRYARLPMGIKVSPGFAQAVMIKLFGPIHDVEVFMDDIAIFTFGAFEDHVNMIQQVLRILQDNGFSIKPKKCHWAQSSVEYLGHIIAKDGIRPQPKKVDAILRLDRPQTPKQLRSFIGMVNYYRDFVRQRAHILQPLTAQTKQKKRITWNDECQAAFDSIKSSLAQDCLLHYPDPNLPFVIEPDASDFQLGSIILQNNHPLTDDEIISLFTSSPSQSPRNFRPVAYFSRKLTKPQRNYTTLEKELLSIVETLIEYRVFLLGRKIFVFSDHRNLTFTKMQSQRALRWRLIAEEYNIVIVHRKGASNTAADALSRLPLMDTDVPSSVRQAEERFYDAYLFYPVQNHMNALYPLDYSKLSNVQGMDQHLQDIVKEKPKQFKLIPRGDYEIIHRISDEAAPSWKIVIPVAHIDPVLEWFHRVLNHPGATRMYRTIGIHFYFPNMKAIIEDYCKTCDICQRIKGPFPKLGHLPLKVAEQNPWEEVQVDLVGPWMFKFAKWQVNVNAITAIDPFVGMCEISRLKNKSCAHVATKFYQMWLARYPRPLRCIHDNGSEFIAQEFQDTLKHYGIQDVPTTVKNPQANSIIERMHLTAGTIFRSMVTEAQLNKRNLDSRDIDDFIDTALSSAQYAINATIHTITRTTPGAFVYQRDMMLPIQDIANWETIRLKKQAQIERNNFRENKLRKPFNWTPGMEVMLEEPTRYKLNPKVIGPFVITDTHTNGTVTIKRNNNTFQKVNIRRIKPYYRRNNVARLRRNNYFWQSTPTCRRHPPHTHHHCF